MCTRGHAGNRRALGLFDLLLTTPEAERFDGFVLEFLRDTDLMDLFGAIAATVIASRRERLIKGAGARRALGISRSSLTPARSVSKLIE